MAKHLTDKQKKKIIADRAEGMSIRQLSQKHKVSTTTIQRVIKSDPEFAQIVTQKKEENTADILAFMETKKGTVNQIIDRYLLALLDEERLEKATPSQLTTALGTLIDKFTANSTSNTTIMINHNIPRASEGKHDH